MRRVICPYCNEQAKLVLGFAIYTHRPDLGHLQFWYCEPCGARTGCHKSSDKPKGSLANEELRKLRMEAHAAFDPLWREGHMSRSEAYRWLKRTLGKSKPVHIGFSREADCKAITKASNHYMHSKEPVCR